MLAVVVAVNSSTLAHCQYTDLCGTCLLLIFVTGLYAVSIFARFSATGMGIGLYVGRLIREYIQYLACQLCY